MSVTTERGKLTTFCQLRPYRHDLCPGTIKHSNGRDWVCACTDPACPHVQPQQARKKRRMVK